MEMAVFLTLHRLKTKVGKQAKSIGTSLISNFGSDTTDLSDTVFPQFSLSSMFFGHGQEHDGYPSENVLDNDNLVILVENISRLGTSDDVTEHTVRGFFHGGNSILQGSKIATISIQHEVVRCQG
tara:strand:- start:813 stop:1187 length:375 start_codon:yes stop_codon:yes gene_type:complete